MAPLGKRTRSNPAAARNFIAKAEQFLAEGKTALARQYFDSALLLAISNMRAFRTSAKAAADGIVRAERFLGWVRELLC